jgi:phage terminase small subunit
MSKASQQRFIEEYCLSFNATQAAVKAGYKPSNAKNTGYKLLQQESVKKAIQSQLDEWSMSSQEALKRLTDWGRGTFAPFITQHPTEGIVLDLSTSQAMENIGLIRKIKQTHREYFNPVDKTTTTEYVTEIELHDAKDAVVQIARIRGLYVNKMEVSGKNGAPLLSPIDLSNLTEEELAFLDKIVLQVV